MPGLTSPPPEDSFSNQEKLAFYGLGQQGTYGDNQDKKPSALGTSWACRAAWPHASDVEGFASSLPDLKKKYMWQVNFPRRRRLRKSELTRSRVEP